MTGYLLSITLGTLVTCLRDSHHYRSHIHFVAKIFDK